MTDKMREEFEAWARANMTFSEMFLGWSDIEQDYVGAVARAMFLGWQASRAALVVELPEDAEAQEFMFATKVMNAGSVIDAIEAAGVRVKQ